MELGGNAEASPPGASNQRRNKKRKRTRAEAGMGADGPKAEVDDSLDPALGALPGLLQRAVDDNDTEAGSKQRGRRGEGDAAGR